MELFDHKARCQYQLVSETGAINLKSMFVKFRSSEDGSSAIEYAIIGAIILAALFVSQLSMNVPSIFNQFTAAVADLSTDDGTQTDTNGNSEGVSQTGKGQQSNNACDNRGKKPNC